MARIKELTNGLGAHSVIEAVGTQESMMQAIRATRPGGHVGYVGMSHDVELPGGELFFSGVHLHGGPAPVRRFLPELIDLISPAPSTPAASSTSTSPWSRPPRATRPWTSAAPSRPSCVHDPRRRGTTRKKRFPVSTTPTTANVIQADRSRRFTDKVAFVTGAGGGIGRV